MTLVMCETRRADPGESLVWLSDDHVLSIDIHVLDHTLGYYRLFRTLVSAAFG